MRVNGQRTKPAHEIKVGDTLAVTRGDDDYEVVVSRIPGRRGPAAEAVACYTETDASLERRRLRSAQRSSVPAAHAPTAGRPDKRTRRLIRARQREPASSE